MAVGVDVRYEDDTANPKATVSAVHIEATEVDFVDETDNSEIRYYLSAEHGAYDAARSPVFAGDYTWDGWVAPTSGVWTFHLRKVSDDSSVAEQSVTFDAP
jgi:hypothetical protein